MAHTHSLKWPHTGIGPAFSAKDTVSLPCIRKTAARNTSQPAILLVVRNNEWRYFPARHPTKFLTLQHTETRPANRHIRIYNHPYYTRKMHMIPRFFGAPLICYLSSPPVFPRPHFKRSKDVKDLKRFLTKPSGGFKRL